jgi:hypothetical protein
MRNALATFGPASTQYIDIKFMVDELATKIALERMSLSGRREEDNDAMRDV